MALFNPDLDIEAAVLGAILLEEAAQIVGFLNLIDSHFQHEPNKLVFQSMLALRKQSLKIDLLTVVHQLRKDNNLDKVGGAGYVADLTLRVNSGAHIETHICILKENYINREINRIESSSTKEIPDAHERLQKLNEQLSEISLVYDVNSTIDGSKGMENTLLSVLEKKPLHLVYGLSKIDNTIRGISKGEMVVVAARPSIGKTDFALFLALQFCRQKKHVVLMSVEMSAEELFKRVAQFILKTDDLTLSQIGINQYEQIMKYYNTHYSEYLHLVEKGKITAEFVEAKTAEFKTKYPENFGAVLIDYIQLMSHNSKNDTEGVTKITNSLKQTAKEYQVAIIALSQLNRNVEHRSDRIPTLSDLRQSGSIEQDADTVLLLHREDYNNRSNPEYQNNLILTVIAAKVRKGSTGNFELHYNPATKVIADTAPLPDSAFTVNEKTGEVFKNINGQNTIDDFNSEKDKPTPF